jgi:hypothetical protein
MLEREGERGRVEREYGKEQEREREREREERKSKGI